MDPFSISGKLFESADHAACGVTVRLWSNSAGNFGQLVWQDRDSAQFVRKAIGMKNKQPDCQISTPPSRQFVITLNVPESAIIRIEALDRSGERYDVPDSELALLAGDYVVEDLHPVGELAYLPGLHDVSGDFELDDCEGAFDEELGPVAVRGGESHRLISREAREVLLGHLLRQRLLGRQCWDQFPPHWEIVFSVRMLLH